MRRIFLVLLSLPTLFTIPTFAQAPGAPIDVKHYTFDIKLNDADNNIEGKATVTVRFLNAADGFNLDLVKKNAAGKGMLVSDVTENGKPVKFTQDDEQLKISTRAYKGNTRDYTISYSGVPADGLIISTNAFGHRTFFGDNWPNRAHNWLPCVDNIADKAPVDFIVTAPDHYQVVSNGLQTEEKQLDGKMKLTHWVETVALPTKVMVIGVAEFAVDRPGDVNGIPVFTYVFPESKETGFKSYAVAKDILPYFIKNVGPYSYEKLANVQSKTIFGGMENASAIFYFEESVKSPEIEELMAHEIAHQWFGDGASEKSFGHLWLSEGFATYMTNLYLESKYGADTLKARLIADRKTVLKFEKSRLSPVVDTAVKTQYMQLLNANSYQKGGWVLHMLRRKLGDDIFWRGIRNYYSKYQGGNANTDDLRRVMEQASGKDLKQFFTQWLRIAGHPNLAVSWKFDEKDNNITINVTQTQENVYNLALEISVDGQLLTVPVKEKSTTARFQLKAKPVDVKIDPNVNLLATFEENK
ncbi:M1 family metallopeptidase [Mucilaginibacter endophyticus]|uniref:M1 family metallopeptidase n=1 Tax=Mucilaginibacter endophyticus TaxID=2675003 RepID=UPI000E0DE6B2|nr:M1 family metallopeptidase [Mucilaginibacter endophyticus]